MKKVKVNDDTVNDRKVSIKEIKRNSDVDILHSIKKVKVNERRIVAVISSIILVALFVCSYFMFAGIAKDTKADNDNKAFVVRYIGDDDGMGDVIDFISEEKEIQTFKTEFTISNNKDDNSWYAIYLDDYVDMIKYDDCFDKEMDKKKIYFSIDGSKMTSLAEVYTDGRYLLMQGVISNNDKVSHVLQVWSSEDASGHYHGKIDVEYMK